MFFSANAKSTSQNATMFSVGRERQRILGALSAKSDDRDVQPVARRLIADAAQHVARHDHHAESELARFRDEIAPFSGVGFSCGELEGFFCGLGGQ